MPTHYTVLHIYDNSTSGTGAENKPTASLGNLIVSANFENSYSRNFNVFIADADASFQPLATRAFNPGVVDVSSISIFSSDHNPVGDPGLRDESSRNATKLFATISGNLDQDGVVTVGQVYRFDAPGIRELSGIGLSGGKLDGTLIATKPYQTSYGSAAGDDLNTCSIQFVRFGKSLEGTLSAEAAGISQVIVGTSGQPECSISGTITAPQGSISSIQCFGPIGVKYGPAGAVDIAATITAGNCIRQIRNIGPENAQATDKINAAISAGTFADDLAQSQLIEALVANNGVAVLQAVGAIALIETGGDLPGGVSAKNIGGTLDTALPRNSDGRRGIIARGELGNIDVRWNVLGADIIGSSIGNVTIGNQLLGSIIAWDLFVPSYPGEAPTEEQKKLGTIGLINIGNYVNELDFGLQALQLVYPAGFIGSNASPIDRGDYVYADREVPVGFRTRETKWFSRRDLNDMDGGSQDCVIYAGREIVDINIKRTSQIHELDGLTTVPKKFRPRIETPKILKQLFLDEMLAGVVWSGRLTHEYTAGSPTVPPQPVFHYLPGNPLLHRKQKVVNTLQSSYMKPKEAMIGCMSPACDI